MRHRARAPGALQLLRTRTNPGDAAGTEPDPRFTLANERTFLAWNRTALALIGGGLAVGQLLDFSSEAARLVCALTPVLLGAVLALSSLRRWAVVQHALRLGTPCPSRAPRSCWAPGWASWPSSSRSL